MRKAIPLLLLLFSLSVHVAAQKEGRALVDSLVLSLPSVSNDTLKARLYNRVFNELTVLNVEEAQQYARLGLAHVQQMKWPKGIAVFQNNLGQSFSYAGQYDSAMYYYGLALATYVQTGDQYNRAATYNNMGAAAQNIRGDYVAAAQFYFKGLQQAEALQDSTLLSLSLGNVSNIYSLQKNYPKALEFGRKAMKMREHAGTPDEVAGSLESIGKTYYASGDTSAARNCFQKALVIYEGSGNVMGLATTWSSLSLVYGPDLRRVLEARIKSKSLWDAVNPLHTEAITNTGNLGLAYLDVVRYDTLHLVKYGDVIPDNKNLLLKKAAEHLQAAIQLAGQTGDMDSKSFFTGALAEVQEYTGDYKQAFYNYRLFKDMQDSVYSQDTKNKIAEAESQRVLDQKNAELKINQLALSNQRKTMWGLAAGVLLLGVIGLLLYRQSKERKKNNEVLLGLNRELDNANRVKARFFAILSHDLRAPIARLISFLHLRRDEPALISAEQAAAHERQITAAAEGLLENMEMVLLWSKSQLEQLQPQFTGVSAVDLFQHLQKQFDYVQDGVLGFDMAKDLVLHTDENCISTILYNLTGNALKAVASKPNPRVYWQAGERDGQLFLSVTDNGGGLDPNLLLDDQHRVAAAGDVRSGLGLSIVKDLAKAINCAVVLVPVKDGTCIELVFDKNPPA
jgi:signal transduction histidine kinase/tetratricopeptide (TPR) repeat protein